MGRRTLRGLAHRVNGTLGNPIVFLMASLLIAPLCMLARTPLNLIAVSLCIVAATMTMSRTGVLIAAVYAAVFLIHRFRASVGPRDSCRRGTGSCSCGRYHRLLEQ